MFLEISVLKNVAIFIGKQLCWSRFLIKLQLYYKETLTHVFAINSAKFLRTASFYRTSVSYFFKLVVYSITFLSLFLKYLGNINSI